MSNPPKQITQVRLLSLALVSVCVYAQPIVLYKPFEPGTATSYLMDRYPFDASDVYRLRDLPAEGMLWNLKELKAEGKDTVWYYTPAQTPFYYQFPDADYAQFLLVVGETTFVYIQRQPQGSVVEDYVIGMGGVVENDTIKAVLGSPFFLVAQQPYLYARWPVSYGERLESQGIFPKDNNKRLVANSVMQANGWGSVILPDSDTVAVLRIYHFTEYLVQVRLVDWLTVRRYTTEGIMLYDTSSSAPLLIVELQADTIPRVKWRVKSTPLTDTLSYYRRWFFYRKGEWIYFTHPQNLLPERVDIFLTDGRMVGQVQLATSFYFPFNVPVIVRLHYRQERYTGIILPF